MIRNRAANETALAAIGSRRKRTSTVALQDGVVRGNCRLHYDEKHFTLVVIIFVGCRWCFLCSWIRGSGWSDI